MKHLFILLPLLALFRTNAQDFTRTEDLAKIDHAVNSNGVAVADYDRDGDLDIFLVGFHSFVLSDESTWSRLFKNNGDGTFEDVTIAAGFDAQYVNNDVPSARGEKMGAAWGDYDNDGYPDLFLTNSREDQLYHNQGNSTFVDVTQQAGVAGCHQCYSASGLWWDHDRDGDLDLYVSIVNGENIMYQNNGDGTFSDVTVFTGLAGNGITWTSVTLDVRRDGFLDLYLANDTQINQFFENVTGLFYNESSRAYRIADEGAGMGIAIGDYNNDGFFDIYVTNIFNHLPNPLLMNTGNRRFVNVAEEMGVDNTGWGWGTHFFDCDHDGDEDLYAVNGVEDNQQIEGSIQEDVDNFFFKNMYVEGEEKFIDYSDESGTKSAARARGLEVFDYDGDGDLDMIVANTRDKVNLYRNETISNDQPNSANWIRIWLEGTMTNRNAFGTEVKITIDEKSYYRWHHGAGFLGQSIKPVHFGLADATTIDEIEVTWLSGLVQTFENIAVNRTITITEGSVTVPTEDEVLEDYPFRVLGPQPNPFYATTNIRFELHEAGTIDLRAFSSSGTEVYRHQQKVSTPGTSEFLWDGSDKNGVDLPSGVYFYTAIFNKYRIDGRIVKIGN